MRTFLREIVFIGSFFILFSSCENKRSDPPEIFGQMMQWHKVILAFSGPETGETDSINPFLDYRLDVTFYKGDEKLTVPGFYAADGASAESGASTGNKWHVVFRPPDFGLWNYNVSFRKGKSIAVNDDLNAGESLMGDGYIGDFFINPTDKTGRDLRAKGRIRYIGGNYLQHEGTGEYFLKAGADSPENFLGYREFDGTFYAGDGERRMGEAGPNTSLHTYSPHIGDWQPGDPVWQENKGKGIIGALNYLAAQGMNSVYMLTNNVEGDGKDVFPWIDYESDFTRFDVSKLAQWEIVFSHMDQLGLMCHFVTQETENELLLDSGNLGFHRKLYYRELIARFAHHLGVTWNLGEENGVAPWLGYGQNDQQRKDMAKYFKKHDPYGNFVVVHTQPGPDLREEILSKLLGNPFLDGPSLQTSVDDVHAETVKWRISSNEKGRPWVVCSDEIGPASTGARPDADDPEHNEIRQKVLWGNLMGGGGGVEWYFGYEFAHNDLNCEDWRSRENLWQQTAHAVNFFRQYLPFPAMQPADHLVSPKTCYALVKGDDLLAVYIPEGGGATVKLNPVKSYRISWFDPVDGGDLIHTDTATYQGVQNLNFRIKGENTVKDWVALIRSSTYEGHD